jgi:hypothetical protein
MSNRIIQSNNSLPIAIIFAIWIAFISWRPWVLGFYHDDWSLLTVTSAYGHGLLEGVYTRPLNFALGYLGVLLFGENTFTWHAYGVLLVLATTVGIYGACNAITKQIFDGNVARKASVIASLGWMLYPWSLGYTAWPVMFPGLVAIALFASALNNVGDFSTSSSKVRWAAFKITIASLIYEAFWFAFIPMTIIFLALNKQYQWQKSRTVFLTLGMPQILLVVWNQMMTYWGVGGGKQINLGWLEVVMYLPVRLLSSFSGNRFLSICLCVIALYLLWILIKRSRNSRNISLILGACIIGITLSVVLYALAGYAISMTGIFSRSTIVINVWLSIAISIIAGIIISSSTTLISSRIAALVILIGLFRLGWGNVHETSRWAASWVDQKQLINRLSQINLDVIQGNSILVMDLPKNRDIVEGFEAYWDTTAALYINFPHLRNAVESGQLWVTISKNNEWITRWDSGKLTQYWCHSPDKPLWEHQAKNAYLFDGRSAAIVKLTSPSILGCAQH